MLNADQIQQLVARCQAAEEASRRRCEERDTLLAACRAALDLLEGQGVRDGYVEDASITVRRTLALAIVKAEGKA